MRRQTIYSLEIAHRTKNDSKKAVCLCRIRPQQQSHWSLTIWRGMFSPSSSKQRVLLFTWMEITPAAAEAEVAQVRWCSLTWYQNSCEGPLIGNNTLVALKREATLTLRQKETFRGPLSPHRIRLGISNFLLELLINAAKCDFWGDFSNTISLSNGWSRSDFKSNEEVCEYWKLWADNQTVFNPLNWCDHDLEIRTPCLASFARQMRRCLRG